MDARNARSIVLMRPLHSMIESDQIIGRGSRLYEGRDYFTIYDFVKAHHHLGDPEWDGGPVVATPRQTRLHPEFFRNEAELGTIWSDPGARRRLLEGLADKGFGHDQLAETQRIINAAKNDLVDVLAHYVRIGVEELDPEKLTPLLRLRYRDSLRDAFDELGEPQEIGRVFNGFQRHLYPPDLAA